MLQHGWTLKICQVKVSTYKSTNIVWFHIYEVPRVIKFIGTESGMVIPRDWEKRMGSYWVQNFSLGRWTYSGDGMDSGDDRTTTWMNLCHWAVHF